jgi:hypothetical protein
MVPNDMLDRLDLTFDLRTPEVMQKVYEDAQKLGSTSAKDAFLRQTGIHDVWVSILKLIMCYVLHS